MGQTVIGMFNSSTEAQHAVEQLGNNGFGIDQVDLTYNTNSVLENRSDSDVKPITHEDDSFGEKVGRFFKSMFDDDDESEKYSRVARNCAIVTVIADDSSAAQRAAEILDTCGAVDVDEKSREYSDTSLLSTGDDLYDEGGRYNETTMASNDTLDESRLNVSDNRNDSDDLDKRSIPIMEEELHVGKREVDRGSVRIRSRIIERPVEESVRLREERISVERNPVNRPATEGDLSTFREGEIEMKQRSEVPVINKEARVVEEVRLNRDVTERNEVVRDTVRKTEVDIDESHVDDDTSTTLRRDRNDDL